MDVLVGILAIGLILIIILSIQQTEPKISVDGNLRTISNIQLPIDVAEAEKIIKEFCEPKNDCCDGLKKAPLIYEKRMKNVALLSLVV